jgi:glycosyltransferase involved in cell wall biosynthesis
MKENISVIIICRNAADTIEKTILSSFQLSGDVIVVDSGSTDGTLDIITQSSARLVQVEWMGYGATKNYGNALAQNDWICSLDADECLDPILCQALQQPGTLTADTIYSVKRLNYLGNKPIHFGEWRNDYVKRIFNRKIVSWDASDVHEKLVTPAGSKTVLLPGIIHHYTSPDIQTYRLKLDKYAALMASKYAARHKKAPWFKRYLSPVVSFIQNYLVKGGFLDGKSGLQIALANARYTFDKYNLLKKATVAA